MIKTNTKQQKLIFEKLKIFIALSICYASKWTTERQRQDCVLMDQGTLFGSSKKERIDLVHGARKTRETKEQPDFHITCKYKMQFCCFNMNIKYKGIKRKMPYSLKNYYTGNHKRLKEYNIRVRNHWSKKTLNWIKKINEGLQKIFKTPKYNKGLYQKVLYRRDLIDGSAVESTGSFCRRPRVGFQNPNGYPHSSFGKSDPIF